MPRFFRRLAEGVFDEADVRARAHELADFVETARDEYGIGAPMAFGYSNGANIAAAVMLLRPQPDLRERRRSSSPARAIPSRRLPVARVSRRCSSRPERASITSSWRAAMRFHRMTSPSRANGWRQASEPFRPRHDPRRRLSARPGHGAPDMVWVGFRCSGIRRLACDDVISSQRLPLQPACGRMSGGRSRAGACGASACS